MIKKFKENYVNNMPTLITLSGMTSFGLCLYLLYLMIDSIDIEIDFGRITGSESKDR